MTSTNNADEVKLELNKLLEEWNENRQSESYNCIKFLTNLSELFEKETEIFHKQDIDPFDDRHPLYTCPNSSLGKLLKALTKQDDFLDVLINIYLTSRRGVTSETTGPTLREVAARLLLVIMPGLDALSIFTENSDIISTLYRWIIEENETLRTYATGILADAVEHQDINSHHTGDNATIVPLLLKRLWNYIEPGTYPSNSDAPSTSGTSSANSHKSSPRVTEKKVKNLPVKASLRKRKISDDSSAKKVKNRRTSEKRHNIPRLSEPHVYNEITDSPNPADDGEERLQNDEKNDINDHSSLANDVMDVSECSNSSWVDMAPILIGYSYSLAPPLSPVTCQLYIIKLLVPLAEYQDLLSHFIEYRAIDLVRYYLDKSNVNNGFLTFSSLRLLASLLCHNKIATKFIDSNGVQRLLQVRRPSIGATGVSICLYYLAYNRDAMERVCHLPHKVLLDLVKYATWLLECSHDSGQCHAALFFNISFQFDIILKLFDQRNGLRYLLNMLSMLPILRIDSEQRNAREDEDSHRQTAKTACQALKKYFETHLTIKANVAKEMLKITHSASLQPSSSSKTIENDREAVLKNLDFLITSTTKLPYHFFSNWTPSQLFIKLDGVNLVLRLIAIACEWTNFYGRTDIVRFALDALAVLTLSPKVQLQLCEPVSLPPGITQETGISIVLGVAEGDAYLGFEPEAQKSALSVIINCVCGPQYKFDGAMGKVVNGTPQARVMTQSENQDRLKMWESVKTNNGIKILLQLLDTQPMFHADDIRLLACKALCGLSRCESVKQIMSKLSVFNSGQLQAMTKQPVMQDGKKHHEQFCKYVEELTERVSGKSNSLDLDLDSLRKAHIVSQTIIRYDNKELLQLIHNHLIWSGLYSTAGILAKEASLYIPSTSSTSIFTTPKTTHRNLGSSGDATFSSPFTKKISFSRGDQALGETPTLPSHSSLSLSCTPTPRRGKKFRYEISAPTDTAFNLSEHYKLASNGKVTVMNRDGMMSSSKGDQHSATLNAIVAGYLQNQHAQCKNPVVTVPEFSLLRQHYCPNPRFRVEAPLNVGSRSMRRQISPKFGGTGGACCDRQFVYSRFRPHVPYRPPDEDKIPYMCCAFTPDDTNVILGNYQGDVVVRGVYSDHIQTMESVCQGPVLAVKPARDGKRLLIIEEGVWRNSCVLFSLQSMDVKLTYDSCYYVEFSKTAQDKVIGTKNTCATIFDAETGQKIQKLERSDLASHYSRNRATFSPDDDLVLSDGLLWDVRVSGSQPIHKFDKFNANISGVFHPQGLEVIINTEIWDLRNYHLLHTVPSINQCSIDFNSDGNIIYAAKALIDRDKPDEEDLNSAWTTFMAIDSHHYRPLSVTDTKHKIYDFAVDGKDCHVAVVENTQMELFIERPSMSLCRLYEIGRVRGEDEDDEDEEGDDNNEDDDLGDNFSDRGSDSDDFTPTTSTPSPSSSLSSGIPGRRRRRTRRRRRQSAGGARRVAGGSSRTRNSEDEEWSTLSDAGSISANDDGTDLDTDAMSDAIHAALATSDED